MSADKSEFNEWAEKVRVVAPQEYWLAAMKAEGFRIVKLEPRPDATTEAGGGECYEIEEEL